MKILSKKKKKNLAKNEKFCQKMKKFGKMSFEEIKKMSKNRRNAKKMTKNRKNDGNNKGKTF